jgi:acyl transferase domain-containing protein
VTASDRAVAIVGLAGRFPGADSPERLWANVRSGVESITFFSADELVAAGAAAPAGDDRTVAARGVLDRAEHFDAEFFGYTAREARTADPQQRLLLEVVWSALDDAGCPPDARGGAGLFVGARANGYAELVTPAVPGPGEALLASMGTDPSFFATRVSYKLGLRGPSMTVQTACSSSLMAVHLAIRALRQGECPVAVAAGVSVQAERVGAYQHFDGSIMSADGHCRPFDAEATGTVGGEGVAAVVLKRLSDAVADGDDVYAVLLGSAANNDGHDKIGYSAPGVAGQVDVVRAALRDAGVSASTVDYLETHGTGTALGDAVELRGLHQVFGPDRDTPLRLGSVKANIGHLDVASGIAGLVTVALALRDGVFPPLANFRTRNPDAPADDVFDYPTAALAWPAAGRPRRAGVSSFGMGGTNVHVVLEQAAPSATATATRAEVVTVSARTPDDLSTLAGRLTDWLAARPDLPPADVAHTLHGGRVAFGHRSAWVTGGTSTRRFQGVAAPPAVALAFSGQGTQRPGGALRAYHRWRRFAAEIDGLCDRVDPAVRDLVVDLSAATGNPPRIAQPAVFVEEYAVASLLLDWGIEPVGLTGNSIGEYAAACLAGVFTPADAAELIGIRGELCTERCSEGRMLAVAAGADRVLGFLGEGTWLAIDAGADRCTVSGTVSRIEALRVVLTEQRIACRMLPVDRAYHSPLMAPMAEEFGKEVAARLAGGPATPLLSSVTGRWLTEREVTDPNYWAGRHLLEPVRLREVMAALAATGATVVNAGPYDGALRNAHPHAADVIPTMPTGPSDPDSERSLLAAAARLWVGGVDIGWDRVRGDAAARRVHLPGYPFAGPAHWPETPVHRSAPPVGDEPAAAGVDADVVAVVGDIFGEVLGVAEPDPTVSFFDLGGDSLTASQVVARVRDAYSVVLTLREFLDHCSIGELARHIDQFMTEDIA